MERKRVHVVWGVICALILAWAVTLTTLYAHERGKDGKESSQVPTDVLSLELLGPSVGLEILPDEGHLQLHLEQVGWHGLARAGHNGISMGARKLTRDTILRLLNKTLSSDEGAIQAVLYELPSEPGNSEPVTVHYNFSVLSLSSDAGIQGHAKVSLEVHFSDEVGISENMAQAEARLERLERPCMIQFYIAAHDHPEVLACIQDLSNCSPGWTMDYNTQSTLLGEQPLCSPRVKRWKEGRVPDPETVGLALLMSGISYLGLIPGAAIPVTMLRIAINLSTALMSSKDMSAKDKWEEIRVYVEKYVAGEIRDAIDNEKIRQLRNAMVGIGEDVRDYYVYPNGTTAKGRTFYSVKTAMASWFGFFTDESNPVGGLTFIIPYGTSYLSWRLQEILSYEEINGEPLPQETYNELVTILKESVAKLQAMPPKILEHALELRKQQIRFEEKRGIFHCKDVPSPPWSKKCGNIKLIDEGTGWASKAYFFANDRDEHYHFVDTVLYDMVLRKAVFNLKVKLEDFVDAASLWSLLVPNNTNTPENATVVYHTGRVGNLENKKEYYNEYAEGGNLTRLKAWSSGTFLDGLELWFDGLSRGAYGHTFDEGELPSQELDNLGEDYIDKVCGVARVNTLCSTQSSLRGVHIANNGSKVLVGSMLVDQAYEGWTFDYDLSATVSPTYLCGMKLGLFGPTPDLEHVDVMDLTFCRNTTRVKKT